MVNARDISTRVLVLQKVPYLGNKFTANVLSPDLGRMTFFLRGAEQARTTKGQPFDLFRVLAVTCHRNSGDLYYPDSVEIVADYGKVSQDYQAYDAACFLAGFAVRNTMPNLSAERYFTALNVTLKLLSEGKISGDAAIACCNVLFLYEAGQLDYENASPRDIAQQEIMVNAALGGEYPDLKPEVWSKLRDWSMALLEHGEFQL